MKPHTNPLALAWRMNEHANSLTRKAGRSGFWKIATTVRLLRQASEHIRCVEIDRRILASGEVQKVERRIERGEDLGPAVTSEQLADEIVRRVQRDEWTGEPGTEPT